MQAVMLACESPQGLQSIVPYITHSLLLIDRHPSLDRLIRTLEAAGIAEILIAATANSSDIRSFVYRQRYRSAIGTIDVPPDSGSAGAIKVLERLIHSTFLTVTTDIVFDVDLRRVLGSHYQTSAVMTVAAPSSHEA